MGELLLRSFPLSPMVLSQEKLQAENKYLQNKIVELCAHYKQERRIQSIKAQISCTEQLEISRRERLIEKTLLQEELKIKTEELSQLRYRISKAETILLAHRGSHLCFSISPSKKASLIIILNKVFVHILEFLNMSHGFL